MKNKLLLTLLSMSISGVALASAPSSTIETQNKPRIEHCKDVENKEECFKGKKEHKKEHKDYMNKVWDNSDTDKDGKISKAEALAVAGNKFDQVDADKDGYVTKDEIEKNHKEKMKEHKDGKKHKREHQKSEKSQDDRKVEDKQ